MSELHTFKDHDLKTYRLKDRPGLHEMIDNLEDEKVAQSLRDGLKLSVTSVIGNHQKIVQLLTLVESDHQKFGGLLNNLKSSNYFT